MKQEQKTLHEHGSSALLFHADDPQEQSGFQHPSSPIVRSYRDYLIQCNLSPVKAALLLAFEQANSLKAGGWIQLSPAYLNSIAQFAHLSPEEVLAAVSELLAAQYIEQQTEEGGNVTYRIHISVVQRMLNSMGHEAVKRLYTDLLMDMAG